MNSKQKLHIYRNGQYVHDLILTSNFPLAFV